MSIDPISIVERAIRETEKRVEREIAEYLRKQVTTSDGVLINPPVAMEVYRLANGVESGVYKS